jgi:hypothetical protein
LGTIINIRGTSGSGKSTLARMVMALYESRVRVRAPDRRQPIGYVYIRPEGARPSLAVVGHYETPCGGADTVPSLDKVFSLVRESAALGYDVLFEGLLVSAEFNRTAALLDLAPLHQLHVVHLDLPLQMCLDSVNARRQAKSPGKGGVNPKNTMSKHQGARSSSRRLAAAGVPVHSFDNREAAYDKVRELLAV